MRGRLKGPIAVKLRSSSVWFDSTMFLVLDVLQTRSNRADHPLRMLLLPSKLRYLSFELELLAKASTNMPAHLSLSELLWRYKHCRFGSGLSNNFASDLPPFKLISLLFNMSDVNPLHDVISTLIRIFKSSPPRLLPLRLRVFSVSPDRFDSAFERNQIL